MSTDHPANPLRDTVRWLAAHARFPATRLEARPERLLCMAALAAAENEADRERFLIQSRNGAKDSALRSHNMRRSLAHYVSDNKQKT